METANKEAKKANLGLKKTREKLDKVPNHIWFLTAFVITAIIVLALFFPTFLKQLTQRVFTPFPAAQKENIAEPAEKPIAPIASGKQLYNISGGTKGGPHMTQVLVDPLDPNKIQAQTLTVQVSNTIPITEITATVITDNDEEPHSLGMIDGTNINGVWRGSWRIRDEYNYNYQIKLVAKNEKGIESTATLTFR